jgi:hypothetical protein
MAAMTFMFWHFLSFLFFYVPVSVHVSVLIILLFSFRFVSFLVCFCFDVSVFFSLHRIPHEHFCSFKQIKSNFSQSKNQINYDFNNMCLYLSKWISLI